MRKIERRLWVLLDQNQLLESTALVNFGGGDTFHVKVSANVIETKERAEKLSQCFKGKVGHKNKSTGFFYFIILICIFCGR